VTPNATITAIRRVTGAFADGRPSLVAVTLIAPIPARVQDPTDRQARDAHERGVIADRLLTVAAAPFAFANYQPIPTDRLTINMQALGESGVAETREIVRVARSRPGVAGGIDVYTLTLDKAEDGA